MNIPLMSMISYTLLGTIQSDNARNVLVVLLPVVTRD